ncbi:MAG: GFA family protein [Caulobacteraceae bacterium]
MANDWKLPWEGGCRCGAVRFRVTAPPLLTGACHCAGCQRMTAGAYSLSVGLDTSAFEVTKGAPVLGGLRAEPKHHHCPDCKSWLFTRPSDAPTFVNLRATMLDDHAWFRPFVEFHRREGFPWAATGARHSFETVPEAGAFGALIREFAAEGVRP